jgi:hypothetical protein
VAKNVGQGVSVMEWKNIAVWLADVTAATAYNYTTKSASKAEKRRQISICSDLALMLETDSFMMRGPRNKEDVVNRLRSTVEELKKFLVSE